MSKELEALKKLVNDEILQKYKDSRNIDFYWNDEIAQEIDIIEKALKDYERYKPLIENIQDGLASAIAFEDLKVLITRSKTLEIIKKKQVAVDEFIRCCKKENNSLEEYNNFAGDKNSLTQDEFVLLKEILL